MDELSAVISILTQRHWALFKILIRNAITVVNDLNYVYDEF